MNLTQSCRQVLTSFLLYLFFRRDHAEEMDDLVDVVNDLRNKEEELGESIF